MFKQLSVYAFLLLLFGVVILGYAQHRKSKTNGSVSNFIEREGNYKADTLALKEFLTPLRQQVLKASPKMQSLVYYALMGRGIARRFNSLNPYSERYFQLALVKARETEDPALLLWAQLEFAKYYYQFVQLEKSLPYFMAASFKIGEISPSALLTPDDSYRALGYFFGTIGEYQDEVAYLKKALHYSAAGSNKRATLLDNLGLYYLQARDTAIAYGYLKEAETLAEAQKDELRLAKVKGNLGQIALGKGLLDTAMAYVEEDIRLSQLVNDGANVCFAGVLKAKIYAAQQNWPALQKTLEWLRSILPTIRYKTEVWIEIEKLKVILAAQLGDKYMELDARRSLSILQDSIDFGESFHAIQRTKIQVAKERFLNERKISSLKMDQQKTLRIMFIIIICLLLVISCIAYIDSRRKQRIRYSRYERKVLAFRMEKLLLDLKFERTNRTMDSYLKYLEEKNRQIEGLQTEIKRINLSKSAYIEEKNGKLRQVLYSHVMTDKHWRKFKQLFEEKYPSYYGQMRRDFSDLSEKSIRFIFLQKLGLSSHETANVLGVSLEAVKKYKQRLRKRFGEEYETVMELIS